MYLLQATSSVRCGFESRRADKKESMEIKGKVHCFFEQSGTFKNEFIKLGIPAEDYDIQDNFGQTDNVIDLFREIEAAYEGGASAFDSITCDDLIMAFFPCIEFCDAKTLFFKGWHISQRKWSIERIMRENIQYARERENMFIRLMKLVAITDRYGLRLIIENPYNTSGMTYLETNFLDPAVFDRNRMTRGDYFVKPTAYWFFGCEPKSGRTYIKDKKQRVIMECKNSERKGLCSEERSMISPDYARNFICDFILGKEQSGSQLCLF